jgi:hypothetical protein
MTVKVEIGFTEAGNSAPFITLNDPVKGVLNNTIFVLGGAEVLVDISEFLESFNITRGQSRELEKFNAGQASVNFYNNTRVFDPTFESSIYFGQIVPKRQMRISVDDEVQFEGTIEDWNISYDAGGLSIASAQAFDGFSFLTNILLGPTSFAEQRTDERIDAILDELEWPVGKRDIGLGGATLKAETVEADTNALEYLDRAAISDPGDFFVSKNGSLKFVGRNNSFTSDGLVFSDQGDAIDYQAIQVVFGSELLYNQVRVESGEDFASASNSVSIALYGERDLVRETLLKNAEGQLETLANFLVTRYGDPEYRFEKISVNLKTVTPTERAELLQAEIGDVVQIKLTPAGIPPAIERYGKIIGINQSINTSEEIIEFSFSSVAGALFVLDDVVFGRLSLDNSLGW